MPTWRINCFTKSLVSFVKSASAPTVCPVDGCDDWDYREEGGGPRVRPAKKLRAVGLPVYANNAAAIAGGLTEGAFFRTGGDPDPVCVVR